MADNVTIPATGSGTATPVVATDDVGGVHYQRVKLDIGADGASTPVTALAPLPVTGPLTDTQLRATAVPVSGTVTVDTSALATSALQTSGNVLTGAVNETAPASDTASSGLNGRLQRIAQRLTSLIAVFTIGAGTEAAAVRVTLPTDGTGKVNAAQSGTWNVTNVSGTVSLPTGAATAAKQPALGTAGSASTDVITVQGIASGTAQPVTGTITAVTAITNALPAGTNTIGAVTQTLPTTGTTSQVNDTASSTTLLSSDSTRKGFRIWNDSTATLYVKYGTTASLTDCTVKIASDGYLEENFYSGRVDGIWSVDASGAARITALT